MFRIRKNLLKKKMHRREERPYFFNSCGKIEDGTVVFSSGITSIEPNAFESCEKLKKIIIPDSVTSIGSAAFMNCCKIESVDIPASVSYIGRNAFFGCIGLKTVTVNQNRSLALVSQWGVPNGTKISWKDCIEYEYSRSYKLDFAPLKL